MRQEERWEEKRGKMAMIENERRGEKLQFSFFFLKFEHQVSTSFIFYHSNIFKMLKMHISCSAWADHKMIHLFPTSGYLQMTPPVCPRPVTTGSVPAQRDSLCIQKASIWGKYKKHNPWKVQSNIIQLLSPLGNKKTGGSWYPIAFLILYSSPLLTRVKYLMHKQDNFHCSDWGNLVKIESATRHQIKEYNNLHPKVLNQRIHQQHNPWWIVVGS